MGALVNVSEFAWIFREVHEQWARQLTKSLYILWISNITLLSIVKRINILSYLNKKVYRTDPSDEIHNHVLLRQSGEVLFIYEP